MLPLGITRWLLARISVMGVKLREREDGELLFVGANADVSAGKRRRSTLRDQPRCTLLAYLPPGRMVSVVRMRVALLGEK